MRLSLSATRSHLPESPVVLVTGASSGIGRAVALGLAHRGGHVVLVARSEDSLDDAARECKEAGAASTLVVPTDIGDDAAVAACVARTLEEHGRIDAAVNAAGVVAYGRTEEIPPDVFEGVVRTNLLGSVNVARHVIPVLRRQRRGSLVLVGSILGHVGAPVMTPYVVSKWGVRALARQLQLENRDIDEVHIGHVAPGGVDTPIYAQGATSTGSSSSPPPPLHSPEWVAHRILATLDHPAKQSQVGIGNNVLRFGFSALPAVYDLVVGPAFKLVALDPTRPVEDTEGNVLESRPEGNRLHGDYDNVVHRLARRVGTVLTGSGSSSGPEA
jgi:NAD(P)-dependent dehydrogenase (short-subunit alcohol dehydrogenase family)